MSTRILDAYLYDKPEEELMKELNSIRDAFHDYLKADIKKDPNKWMRWGKNIVDKGKDTGEDSLTRAIRYIKAGLETVENGNPLDVAANCVVVKHRKKIVLWFFAGMNFKMFAKKNEILKRIRKNEYWWMDSGTANGIPKKRREPTTSVAGFGNPHSSTSKHMCLRVWGSRMNFSRMKTFSAWAIFFIWNMNLI